MSYLCILKRHPKDYAYTCSDVKRLYNQWLDEFIKTNAVNVERKESDRMFMEYKNGLDDFLAQCPHKEQE